MKPDHDPGQTSLDATLAAQTDLDALCRERPLETREIFPPNAFYGNDRALKAYAGWPADRPLKLIVPHGVVFNRDYLWQTELRSSLPVVMAYPDYRIAAYRGASRKLVVAGTAPFEFVCRLMADRPKPQRRGTLYFPAHSTHGVTAETDHAAIADALARLDARYHPIRICIYWKDYLAGRHLPYAARGFEVVSAGHMYDPAFLFRLYHLLSMHRYASSATEGSYIFHAVQSGCTYFHLPGFDVNLNPNTAANSGDVCSHPEAESVIAAFGGEFDQPTSRQRDLTETFIGAANLPTPAALRALLQQAEQLDRFGIARGAPGGGLHWHPPSALPRSIGRAVRSLLAAPAGAPRGRQR
jgi:hypothetical protein